MRESVSNIADKAALSPGTLVHVGEPHGDGGNESLLGVRQNLRGGIPLFSPGLASRPFPSTSTFTSAGFLRAGSLTSAITVVKGFSSSGERIPCA
jgi:hypothetical protein